MKPVPLLLYPSTSLLATERITALFYDEGIKPNIVQEISHVTTAISLVACGLGICITPLAASGLELPRVVWRPIKHHSPVNIDLVCMYRRGDEAPVFSAFLALVRQFGARA